MGFIGDELKGNPAFLNYFDNVTVPIVLGSSVTTKILQAFLECPTIIKWV